MANWQRKRREWLAGFLYSALLMVVIAVAAQALLSSDNNGPPGQPMTIEAVLTPTPVPDPVPATEPRSPNR
jgi:hypothetical protein